jgi:hypothetical protein
MTEIRKIAKLNLKKKRKFKLYRKAGQQNFFYGQEGNKDKDVNEFEMFDWKCFICLDWKKVQTIFWLTTIDQSQ